MNGAPDYDFELLITRMAIVHAVLRLEAIPERSSHGHLLWLHPDGRRTP